MSLAVTIDTILLRSDTGSIKGSLFTLLWYIIFAASLARIPRRAVTNGFVQ
jgi:hypothetical protein